MLYLHLNVENPVPPPPDFTHSFAPSLAGVPLATYPVLRYPLFSNPPADRIPLDAETGRDLIHGEPSISHHCRHSIRFPRPASS